MSRREPPKLGSSIGARSERFSITVDTDRWWGGAPEAFKASIVEHKGTLLLCLVKLNRRSQGITRAGTRKPHKYQQSTRIFCYNLGDIDHVHSFLHTFRHMVAKAAGMQHNSGEHLLIGQQQILSRARLHLQNDVVDSVKFDGEEILELICENANYRNPSDKIYAQDPTVRQQALDRWRKNCQKKPRHFFRLRRVLTNDNDEIRAYAVNNASELTIPLEAVEKLAAGLQTLLRNLWSYTVRHPEQVDYRYEGSRQRWQLHRLQPVDTMLLPRIAETLTFRQEPALFSSRELYDASTPRMCPNVVRITTLDDYHPIYLKRLLAFAAGELHWSADWKVSEWEALNDVARVRQLLYVEVCRKLYVVLRLRILAFTMKRKPRHKRVAFLLPSACLRGPYQTEQSAVVELHARGPPLFCK